MATSTVPIGNPAGNNQANPALKASSSIVGATAPTMNPIPGGSIPSSTNPYLIGGGAPPGAVTSGTVPGSTPTALPSNFNYTAPGVLPGSDPGQQQLLSKQFVDIAGKGVGGQLAQQYAGMAGTDSAIFQQWLQGQAPVWQQQRNQLGQTLGAAGVGANSTVAALGEADLGAQQAAQAGTFNAQLMEQNQQNQLNILKMMEPSAEKEVASSGWDVFGQVMGGVADVAASMMGDPMAMANLGSNIGSIGKIFGGGGSGGGGGSVPSVGTSDMPTVFA